MAGSLLFIALLAAAPKPPAPGATARSILDAACARCHAGGAADEGGFDFVLDRARLIDARLVVPGDSKASTLLRRVERGEMPPAEAMASLSPEARLARRHELADALAAWIRAGAPAAGFSEQPAAPPSDWKFVTVEDHDQ